MVNVVVGVLQWWHNDEIFRPSIVHYLLNNYKIKSKNVKVGGSILIPKSSYTNKSYELLVSEIEYEDNLEICLLFWKQYYLGSWIWFYTTPY